MNIVEACEIVLGKEATHDILEDRDTERYTGSGNGKNDPEDRLWTAASFAADIIDEGKIGEVPKIVVAIIKHYCCAREMALLDALSGAPMRVETEH